MTAARLPKGPWYVPARSRVAALPRSEQSILTRIFLLLTRRAARSPKDLNVFTLLARLGPTFPRYLLFLSHMLKRGVIARADKERIILRVAWKMGCVYEWGHHVPMATELGVSDAEVRSLAEPVSDEWSPRHRAIIAAIDELIDDRRLGDENWARLSREMTDDQMVEFCMLVGHYVMVAMTINSAGVQLEQGFLEDASRESGDPEG